MGGVGKSAVTYRYVNDNFINEHDPTVEDSWKHDKLVDGVSVQLDILDTAGIEEYEEQMYNWVSDKDACKSTTPSATWWRPYRPPRSWMCTTPGRASSARLCRTSCSLASILLMPTRRPRRSTSSRMSSRRRSAKRILPARSRFIY